jgi:peroxiredoxin
MTAWWRHRWVRAAAVAIAIAAWPACNRQTEAPREDQAPLDFVLKDVAGKDVRLADFRGKPLLVNFWATWCGPCKIETPYFVDFVEKYKKQGLQIVGISIDDTPADIQAFVKEYRVNYPMLVGNGRDDLFRAFEAESVYPVTWIVRSDGTVQAKAVGLRERDWFEQELEAAFLESR